jgi:hypothetical protein
VGINELLGIVFVFGPLVLFWFITFADYRRVRNGGPPRIRPWGMNTKEEFERDFWTVTAFIVYLVLVALWAYN